MTSVHDLAAAAQAGPDCRPSREPFATLHLEHTSTVDRAADELRRAIFDGELESGTPLREVALADSLGRLPAHRARGAHGVLVAEGLATREPNRGVERGHPAGRLGARRLPRPLGPRGRRRPELAEATAEQRDQVRATLTAYTDAVRAGASYQELNERHLAFHVSLVGLTGSPRLVRMAENLVDELKLALAQVDRIRRNAHDQADSHTALVRLLEADDVDGRPPRSWASTWPTPRSRSSRRFRLRLTH